MPQVYFIVFPTVTFCLANLLVPILLVYLANLKKKCCISPLSCWGYSLGLLHGWSRRTCRKCTHQQKDSDRKLKG